MTVVRSVLGHRRSRARMLRALFCAAVAVGAGRFLLDVAPAAADVSGVARVIDGDTIEVAGERVRLSGIDAPETRQTCEIGGLEWPCGRNATANLAQEADGRTVVCRGNKRDRYGRLLAVCYLGDIDLNGQMVANGWALAYRHYSKQYVSQEAAARASGAGLWRGQFVEPWEWRKQTRHSHQP